MSKVIMEDVCYVNTNENTVTDRTIIHPEIPINILTIDVTELGLDQQFQMLELYNQYHEFKSTFMKAMPSFETWAEQQEQVYVTPKWRSMRASHIIKK